MYSFLLVLHSLFRWAVLMNLLIAIYRAYQGWLTDRPFTKVDNLLRHTTATVLHIQLSLGMCLYFISPIVDYFLHNFSEAVHMREIRFFGMEHITMMVIAVVLVTMGSIVAKRRTTDQQKFKTMAIWFTVGFVIILTSIPWKFSPFTSRPYFRTF
jgi:hypothetical protein